MFVLFVTRPHNYGTQGYSSNFAGSKGLTRKSKHASRGYKDTRNNSMNAVHLGKRTVYNERKPNRNPERKLCHFAR